MSGKVFILSGASGSGKSTLMQRMCERYPDVVIAPKYTTRPRREQWDDIIPVNDIDSNNYDIAYFLNKSQYGIRANEVLGIINSGNDAMIVLSDFRVIQRLKETLGENAVAIYISSPIDRHRLMELQSERHQLKPTKGREAVLGNRFMCLRSAQRLQNWNLVNNLITEIVKEWRQAVPEMDSAEVRAEKIRTLHIRYVDNLQLFDHIILNYTTPDDLERQMVGLRKMYAEGGHEPVQRGKGVLYVVAAASGAGKGTLMQVLNTIGRDRIRIVSKAAGRDPKENDKRDGMIAIGEGKEIPECFDIRYIFHAGKEFKGTPYGIRSDEIEENFREEVQQIVVSNMDQFQKFRHRYGQRVVFLYLHATRSREEAEAYQYQNCKSIQEAKQRINEIEEVHQAYIDRISEFNHVLLNTTNEEDMYDQMFQLIDYYR